MNIYDTEPKQIKEAIKESLQRKFKVNISWYDIESIYYDLYVKPQLKRLTQELDKLIAVN
ncbi:MAG TPA: hypothetical protein PLL09_04605 [Flavobacterium sp.]|uniref:hypothetical protein n=1 Tax=unclassified Flavobacterium TaxID=196869 RepID=UPI0025B92DA9|nr:MULTISPECIES: hypothetical protein [unclassified Flavobacterium]HRE77089.1 hypothetical protein [Flavobacterium sp.]